MTGFDAAPLEERPVGQAGVRHLLEQLLGDQPLPTLSFSSVYRRVLVPGSCALALLEGAVEAGILTRHRAPDLVPDAPAILRNLVLYRPADAARRLPDGAADLAAACVEALPARELLAEYDRTTLRALFLRARAQLPEAARSLHYVTRARAALCSELLGESANMRAAAEESAGTRLLPGSFDLGGAALARVLGEALEEASEPLMPDRIVALLHLSVIAAHALLDDGSVDLARSFIQNTEKKLTVLRVPDPTEVDLGMVGKLRGPARQLRWLGMHAELLGIPGDPGAHRETLRGRAAGV